MAGSDVAIVDEVDVDVNVAPGDGAAEEKDAAQELSRRHGRMLEHCDRIVEQTRRVKFAEAEWLSAKESASNLKKEYEREQERLVDLGCELRDIQSGNYQRRLFEDADPNDPKAVYAAWVESDEGGKTALADVRVEIDGKAAKLTASQLEKLEELVPPVTTVRGLEELIAADRLRDVRGFGKTAVDRVSDIVAAFRDDYPMPPYLEPATEDDAE